MNKAQLTEIIAGKSGVTKAAAGRVLEAFMGTVTDALIERDDVVLTGFGSFKSGERKARKGRNPQTGKEISIPAKKTIHFTAGKNLKDAVNGEAGR